MALSTEVAIAFGVGVGDTVRAGPRAAASTVVGVVARASSLDSRFAVVLPDEAVALLSLAAAEQSPPSLWWSLDAVPPNGRLGTLVEAGWGVTERSDDLASLQEHAGLFDPTNLLLIVAAAVVLAELALICAGVFLAMQGSRTRQSAVLASLGATRRVRLLVSAVEGAACGVVGGVGGIAAGLLAARAAMSWYAARDNQIWQDLTVPWGWLVALASIVCLSGTLAATVAALQVPRDVLAEAPDGAATDRRLAPRRVGTGLAGVVVCGAGALLGSTELVVVGVLALVVTSPWLVRQAVRWVAGTGGLGSPAWRLGSRLPARSDRQAGLVGTIIVTLVVLAGVLSAGFGGTAAQVDQAYRPPLPPGATTVVATKSISRSAASDAARLFGVDRAAVFAVVAPPEPQLDNGDRLTYWGAFAAASPSGAAEPGPAASPGPPVEQTWLYAAAAADVEVAVGRSLSAAERADFDAGQVLATDPQLVSGGTVVVTAPPPTGDGGPITTTVPARHLPGTRSFPDRPSLFLAAGRVPEFGGVVQPVQTVLYLPGPSAGAPDTRLEARLDGLLSGEIGREYFAVSVERGPPGALGLRTVLQATLALLLAASVAVALVMVGLVAHDLRTPLTLLHALGADRRMRTAITTSQGVTIVAAGLAVGTVVSLVGSVCWVLAAGLPWTSWWWAMTAAEAVFALAAAAAAGASFGRSSRSLARTLDQ
jgi:hypothetical protein